MPKDNLQLWHVGKFGDSSALVGFKKQGGVVCTALFAAPPAPESGGLPPAATHAGAFWPEGSCAGTPAMRAVEEALLAYVRELQDVRAAGRWKTLSGYRGGVHGGCVHGSRQGGVLLREGEGLLSSAGRALCLQSP